MKTVLSLCLLLAVALNANAAEVICDAKIKTNISFQYSEGTAPIPEIESHFRIEGDKYVFDCPPNHSYTYTGTYTTEDKQKTLDLVFTISAL